MKKKVLGILTLIMIFGSATSMTTNTENLIGAELPVSCFEEGNLYAEWWSARTNSSAIQRLEMALLYTRLCEQERAPKFYDV